MVSAAAIRPAQPDSEAMISSWSAISCGTPSPRPRNSVETWAARQSTGLLPANAVASPGAAYSTPGPEITRKTPILPVERA